MVQQRLRGAVAFFQAALVAVGGTRRGGTGRLVDVVPRDIDGQLVWNVLQRRWRLGFFRVALRRFLHGVVVGLRYGFVFVVVLLVRELQHRVGFDGLVDFGAQFGGGELHEANRLLHLHRHRLPLAEAQPQDLLHHSRNPSPR